jgi:hypothetical protein
VKAKTKPRAPNRSRTFGRGWRWILTRWILMEGTVTQGSDLDLVGSLIHYSISTELMRTVNECNALFSKGKLCGKLSGSGSGRANPCRGIGVTKLPKITFLGVAFGECYLTSNFFSRDSPRISSGCWTGRKKYLKPSSRIRHVEWVGRRCGVWFGRHLLHPRMERFRFVPGGLRTCGFRVFLGAMLDRPLSTG